MPNLKYTADKRTPYQKVTTNEKTFNKYKKLKVSQELSIPANNDYNITISRYLFGVNAVGLKFRLIQFYLNKYTFSNYQNNKVMTNIIKYNFGIINFIEYSIECISFTPELFTTNKAHYIASHLLNLSFELIKNPNNEESLIAYSSLLGYLSRDQLSYSIYGVHKGILNLKPLLFKNNMNNKATELVRSINYLINNNGEKYIELYCDKSNQDDINLDMFDIISPDNDTDFFDDSDSDLSDSEELFNDDNNVKVDDILCHPNPTLYQKKINEEIEYWSSNDIVTLKDIATFDFPDDVKKSMQPILNLIPRIRKEAGYMVPKNYKISQERLNNLTDFVTNSLPKPFSNLLIKHKKHLCIAGGYLTNLINNVKSVSSDIDIFIMKTDEETKKEIYKDIVNCLQLFDITNRARVSMRHSVATVASKYLNNIQFIQSNYTNPDDLINEFDLTSVKTYFTFNNNKCHIDGDIFEKLINYSSTVNNNFNLHSRTLKYLAKGFKLKGDWELHKNNIMRLISVCEMKSNEVIKAIGKHYHINDESEEEIEKNMNDNIGGKYIGNHFEQLYLHEFIKYSQSYTPDEEPLNNQHFMIGKNIMMTHITTIKPNIPVTHLKNELCLTLNKWKLNSYNLISEHYIPLTTDTKYIRYFDYDSNNYSISIELTDKNIINKLEELDNYFKHYFENKVISNKSNIDINKCKYCEIVKEHTDGRKFINIKMNNNYKYKKNINILDQNGQEHSLTKDNLNKFDRVTFRVSFNSLYISPNLYRQGCYGLTKSIYGNISVVMNEPIKELTITSIDSSDYYSSDEE